jgi:hypothetical protein
VFELPAIGEAGASLANEALAAGNLGLTSEVVVVPGDISVRDITELGNKIVDESIERSLPSGELIWDD